MVNYKLYLIIYDAEKEIIARLPFERVNQSGEKSSFFVSFSWCHNFPDHHAALGRTDP